MRNIKIGLIVIFSLLAIWLGVVMVRGIAGHGIFYVRHNAIDNSSDQSLQDVSICQYSDLSIYIDNSESSTDLTDENTVKELYIDNIVITSQSDIGTKILNYKNPLNFSPNIIL